MRIHGRYQRAGRAHKTRILDEFCAACGYHRKSALRLLGRPLWAGGPRGRPGPRRIYEPAELLPVLKTIWLASDPLCNTLLRAALPERLGHHEDRHAPLAARVKAKLLAISPAQIGRLLGPTRGGPADASQLGAVAEVRTGTPQPLRASPPPGGRIARDPALPPP